MDIKICIGSSCHLKGSRQVVERLKELIKENNADEKVTLSGTFCMSKCQQGVCVTVDEELYSVTPETVDSFFENTILNV